MNYLAIDTSNKSLIVAACRDGEAKIYVDEDCGVRHSVEVMQRVEQVLADKNLTLDDLDFIACVVGAGSFTGIRIGVSTAKALCLAKNLPCLAITSFDTLAYNYKGEKTMAVIDAGHGGFYIAAYDGGLVSVAPSYILLEDLKNFESTHRLLSMEPIDGLKTEVVPPAIGLIAAIKAKQDEITYDYDELDPVYVRKSQAEEGRP